MLLNPFAFLAVFFGYFLSLVLYFLNFESQNTSFSQLGKKIAAASLILHFIFILGLFVRSGQFVIANLSEYVYLGSFFILLLSFFIEWRYKAQFLMLFSLPIVLLFCLLAILLSSKNEVLPATSSSFWHWLHTGLILGGFTSLIVAVSGAFMYLLQSSQLKSKHLGNIFLKLPSLNTLDKIHFTSLFWGTILFSLGIVSGIFWANDIKESGQILKDPMVILSFFTCFLYWVILSFRLSALRRGHKIAFGTVLIFVFLFVTLISSHFSAAGFHKGF